MPAIIPIKYLMYLWCLQGRLTYFICKQRKSLFLIATLSDVFVVNCTWLGSFCFPLLSRKALLETVQIFFSKGVIYFSSLNIAHCHYLKIRSVSMMNIVTSSLKSCRYVCTTHLEMEIMWSWHFSIPLGTIDALICPFTRWLDFSVSAFWWVLCKMHLLLCQSCVSK